MKQNSLKKGKNLKVSGNLSTKDLDYLEKSTKKFNTSEKTGTHLWNAPDVVAFAEEKLEIKLDDWQKEYILHEGNTVIRAARQSGKSFAESLRVALFALLNSKTTTLIIASVDRQSVELLEKVKSKIMLLAPQQISKTPTFHKIILKNGSKVLAEPAGATGYGLRGFTIDKLVADEAHYIQDAVFVAVRPMLAITGGTLDLLSTPRGNEGFFYDCFEDDTFWKKHVRWEDCTRYAEGFIEQERKRMTKLEFSQEYDAEFVDALMQFYSKELIVSCFSEDRLKGRNTLGVDFAGHGGDPNAFVSIASVKKQCYIFQTGTTENQAAWKTIMEIKLLNNKNNYIRKGIGVDDGGLGSAILDFMLLDNELKYKAVGLNNATREIDKEGKSKILHGIEMHCWLKIGMEQGLLKFSKDNDELIRAFTSIQYVIDKETKNIKIHGRYDHLIEAAKRAYWLQKTKGLNIMAFC